jgi:hypothetical protein
MARRVKEYASGVTAAYERNGRPEPVGRLLDGVEPEQVGWLYPKRIPLGKLTVVDGDPGLGKSATATDFGARVSVGRTWPDGAPCEVGGVVICSAEDGLADTIRPRLEAAGADLSRVLALDTIPDGDAERPISIPEDLDVVRRGIERVGARLVIFDPLMAFLSADVNGHRDQDVRRALAPLAKLAEDTGAAILIVRHLNKTEGGNPLYRGGGSIGITGAARSALLVARDPEDDDRRVLATLKSNLSAPAPSLAFTLSEAANGAVRVEWKGSTPLDARTLLAVPSDDEERRELTALKSAVVGLLEGSGGAWEGTPTELHDLLAGQDLAALPDRPDELTKRLQKAARTGTAFTASRGWRRVDGKPTRTLRLRRPEPPNGVDRVDGVDNHGVSVNAVNADDTDEGVRGGVVRPGGDGPSEECIHGYPGGRGCYLRDTDHPHRRDRGEGRT